MAAPKTRKAPIQWKTVKVLLKRKMERRRERKNKSDL
jgi:hypothetical protein